MRHRLATVCLLLPLALPWMLSPLFGEEASPHGPAWNWLVHEDEALALRFEVPLGWTMKRPSARRIEWGGPEGTASWYQTMNLQQLNDPDLKRAAASFEGQLRKAGAEILASSELKLAGMAAHSILIRIRRQDSDHLFRYLLVARPAGVALLSFATPAVLGERFAKTVQHVEDSLAPLPGCNAAPDLAAAQAEEKEIMAKAAATEGHPDWLRKLATLRASMAEGFRRAGRVDEAVDYLTSSLQIEGQHVDRLEALGSLLEDRPEPAARPLAQSYWADALALAPGNRSLRARLAASLMASGQFDAAQGHYETLCENRPGLPDDEYARPLALLYLSQHREAEGRAFMARMDALGGGPRFALFHGVFLAHGGDRDGAAEEVRRVLKKPGTPPAIESWGKELLAQFTSPKGAEAR